MALDVQSVSYHYPNSGKIALSSVSHTFGPGATAIVGPNGAGKSTLVKLLAGLLPPTSGQISARSGDDTVLHPEQVHKSVLFQEPSHLCLSIRQNMTMRYETTPGDDSRIEAALRLAGLANVVDELPDGVDTLVGAGFGGQIDLSGGQWQRLALARLIFQDAPVMILDEPVASLDPQGERAVFQLMAQRTDKIMIFTTHRYDSIPPQARILVLVDGRIRESGTHTQLLQRGRDYWSLYVSSSATRNGHAQPALAG
jgi:ATP-binding cassette, subfamily B, bacterial